MLKSIRMATVLVLLVATSDSAALGQKNLTMDEIAQNVRVNEALYRNVEVQTRWVYKQKNLGIPGLDILEDEVKATRAIFQGDYFYFSFDKDQLTYNKEKSKMQIKASYDGKISKYIMDHSTGYQVDGKYKERRYYDIAPHNYFLRNLPGNIFADLSDILSGSKSLQSSPGGGGKNVRLDLEGFENYDAHDCAVVRAVFYGVAHKGELELKNCTRFWLAMDRNYIPVKVADYSHKFGDVPVRVGTVDDFIEIAPGLFYPSKAKFTVFHLLDGLKDGRFPVHSEDKFTAESVKFAPNYPQAFFTDAVKFTDDLRIVYMSNGKVVGSRPRPEPTIP